jgi:hypothetical protein
VVDALSDYFSSTDGVLFQKNGTQKTLFSYPCNRSSETYSIPSTVNVIGDLAFNNSAHLKSLNVPSSVTSISSSAFLGGTSLTSFVVDAVSDYFNSTDGVLFNADRTTLIAYPVKSLITTYSIPSTVKIIGDYAFSNCADLTNVTIPQGVESIGVYAFHYCTGLASLTIPSSVNEIKAYAFESCMGLRRVDFLGNGPPDNLSDDGLFDYIDMDLVQGYYFIGTTGWPATNVNIPMTAYPPTVSGINSITSNGRYVTGSTISLQVAFSETVAVDTLGGTPTLSLETGSVDRTASYVSGSGSSILTFIYTVQSGDISADLDYVSTTALALNGGTIKGVTGTAASLSILIFSLISFSTKLLMLFRSWLMLSLY